MLEEIRAEDVAAGMDESTPLNWERNEKSIAKWQRYQALREDEALIDAQMTQTPHAN